MLSSLIIIASLFSAQSGPLNKPNIVYIMADDLGYTDPACYGSKYYETPNIDYLASQGMRFLQGYSCGPNCQPTRAALMSGQYGPRTGIYTVGNIDRFDWQSRPLKPVENVVDLPLKKITLADSLKSNGYKTALFGKWHLGQQGEHHPSKRGFDEAIVSMGKHYDFVTMPKVAYPQGTYLADFLTNKAVNFINQNKEKPFFLCVHHFGVHSPYEAKKELIERFQKKQGVGGHNNPTYAAMLFSVDESVGKILKTLDDLNLSKNTLVIFTSDNGGVGGYAREGIKQGGDKTDNTPLRGGKGMLYEGGIRVPYIFRMPGTINPGTTSNTPICSVDLYPTLHEFSKSELPKNYRLDGESYFSQLQGDTSKSLKRSDIFWHFPGYLGAGENTYRTKPVSVIRSGNYKLLEFLEDGKIELYNLIEDVGEKNNLASQMPDLKKELYDKLTNWRNDIKAPMPSKNIKGANTLEIPKKKKKQL
ncbi:MAG: sulfatase [Planctomycetota bacterium]